MKVYEISVLCYLLKDMNKNSMYSNLANYIDSCLCKKTEFLKLHNENIYKNYVFNGLYPIQRNGIYIKGDTVTFQIRTVNKELAEFFNTTLNNHHNNEIKGLSTNKKIIPKEKIERIYSLTPAIIKNDYGYWRSRAEQSEFEYRLNENLIKKYNEFNNTNVNTNFQFYKKIEFKNRIPISIQYKNIKLLGDKLNLIINDDETSQDLAYYALGSGILEMNSRGFGFVNFRNK